MQLHTCPARLSNDTATFCELQVTAPLPFCAHHYREYCTLQEQARAARREADTLNEMVEDSADGYTMLREVKMARGVAELYSALLERQVEVGVALRVRFIRDDALESLSDIEAMRKRATALVRRLADRECVLAAEDKAKRAAADLCLILSVPHMPFSCRQSSENGSTIPDTRCPTIRLTSQRCTQTPGAGQRLCMLHIVTHTSISVVLRTLWNAMEASRMKVARIEVGKGSLSNNANAVRHYVVKVNDVVEATQIHQKTYSCRMLAEHDALAEDLRKRMIAAMLVLGELEGGQEFQTALRQGHAEAWATEHLEKVIKGDGLVGDIAAGAVMGAGLSAIFGGPIGIGAFFGATIWASHAAGNKESV